MQYICANKDKDFLKRKQEGALAHLARARHWQCRGDEFESHTLHEKAADYQLVSGFLFFLDYLMRNCAVTGQSIKMVEYYDKATVKYIEIYKYSLANRPYKIVQLCDF